MHDPVVILFYKFARVPDPSSLADSQRALALSLGLRGRLLIASEGINGTFEGTRADVEQYTSALRRVPGFEDITFKESVGTGDAFRKLEVRVRPEVVTLGAGEFDIAKETAREITADELDALYDSDEEFVVLDLRNEYETRVGRFENTVDPQLKNFRDLPGKLTEIGHLKQKKVIAVCTGGIRCEKATCLLKREGFEDLYQLKDGIHTYMQRFPGKHFKGTLFVFDNRMTTPVSDVEEREVVGRCFSCGAPCEELYNDDTVRPSEKYICCSTCVGAHPDLRPV